MVLLAVVFVTLLAVANVGEARIMRKDTAKMRRAEAAERSQRGRGPPSSGPTSSEGDAVKNITFMNPRASRFFVDGDALPLVDFDVGPSWAGLLPISNSTDETRQLFFWFFPPGPDGSLDDLIFWTNGGPGCSSLEGLLQENGPFSWSFGQAKPTINEHSWTNLSSVLWVEQPVGTGFSQGIPNIENEDQLAAQLVGFMQQFLEVFSELKGKKLWLAGESYAGTYVPYIANYIYENPMLLDLPLQGIWINDPSISWDVVQQQIPAVDFVHKYQGLFSFNKTYLGYLDNKAAACNYTNYVSTYVNYPPKGPFPLPGNSVEPVPGCDVWDDIFNASLIINPAFNMYRIWDTEISDFVGHPRLSLLMKMVYRGSFLENQTVLYFDRRDVKEAIHAPLDTQWTECSSIDVFPNGDASLPPSFTVLPNVIEKSVRTVIVHGLADFILIAQGARIAIQNMTWNGLQGFQTPILDDSFIVDGVGAFGTMHSERGLTYVEIVLSGHMVPQFSPVAAFQIMQYLMGFRDAP